jgi:hypothetical protein
VRCGTLTGSASSVQHRSKKAPTTIADWHPHPIRVHCNDVFAQHAIAAGPSPSTVEPLHLDGIDRRLASNETKVLVHLSPMAASACSSRFLCWFRWRRPCFAEPGFPID